MLRRRLVQILPGSSEAYSFDTARMASGGIALALRYQTARGDVPTVEREIGKTTFIGPLFKRNLDEERYWVSLSINWDEAADGSRTYIYRTAGITVFQGDYRNVDKLQLLRVEWAGLRKVRDGEYEFEASETGHTAGHPHWHVDALRAIKEKMQRQREEVVAHDDLFRQSAEEQGMTGLDELLAAATPSNKYADELDVAWATMHLAQCAPWSEAPLDGRPTGPLPHARNPGKFQQVAGWISSNMLYIKGELSRATGQL